MDADAQHLLAQIKREQQRTSERMHRDARRQHTLQQASLKLGVGHRAEDVLRDLGLMGIVLMAVKPAKTGGYDVYARES